MALHDNTQNKVRDIKDEYKSWFKGIQKTGTEPDHPGIYECQSCGFEDLINRECEKLPPCSECDGSEWKLIVYAMNSQQKNGRKY